MLCCPVNHVTCKCHTTVKLSCRLCLLFPPPPPLNLLDIFLKVKLKKPKKKQKWQMKSIDIRCIEQCLKMI